MARKKKFVDPDQPYFRFLARLRSGGRSNMYGAIPYLVDEFRIVREEAFRIVCRWVDERAEAGGDGARDERPSRVLLPSPAASRPPRTEQMSMAFDGGGSSRAAGPVALPDLRRKRAARAIPRAAVSRVPPAPVSTTATKQASSSKPVAKARTAPVSKPKAAPRATPVPKVQPAAKTRRPSAKPKAAPVRSRGAGEAKPVAATKPAAAKSRKATAKSPAAKSPAARPQPRVTPAKSASSSAQATKLRAAAA